MCQGFSREIELVRDSIRMKLIMEVENQDLESASRAQETQGSGLSLKADVPAQSPSGRRSLLVGGGSAFSFRSIRPATDWARPTHTGGPSALLGGRT